MSHRTLVRPLYTRMFTLAALMLILVVTSGCEVIWTVPPASGRVLDARSRQPVAGASVTRITMSGATNQTASDTAGHFDFRGKRSVQVFPFGDVLAWASYRIEATGYQTIETNRTGYGSVNELRHEFGEIQLLPK